MSKVVLEKRKLTRIRTNVSGNVAEVVEEIGEAVAGEARQIAPVDKGSLRDGIYVRKFGKGSQLPTISEDVERVELPEPEDRLSVSVGPSVLHGIFQELGTTEMAAQPFMAPAFAKIELARFGFGKALTDDE